MSKPDTMPACAVRGGTLVRTPSHKPYDPERDGPPVTMGDMQRRFEPKTCLGCGAKEQPGEDLTCGH